MAVIDSQTVMSLEEKGTASNSSTQMGDSAIEVR